MGLRVVVPVWVLGVCEGGAALNEGSADLRPYAVFLDFCFVAEGRFIAALVYFQDMRSGGTGGEHASRF